MSDIVTLYVLDKFKKKLADLESVVREEGPEGPKGPKGDKGDRGAQGAQGPKGTDGAQGAKGVDGSEGPEGPEGKQGISVVDAYLSADSDIVFVLDNGTEVPVEMPLVTSEDGQVVMYSQGGGSGVDGAELDKYVLRPADNFEGKWLLYRELADGTREWSPATTDAIETNGNLIFRDAEGRFKPTPEELDNIDTQLKANRFMWEKIQEGFAEQETIKNKVNALEGVVGEHSLIFTTTNSNPRHGEFNLKDGGMQITNTVSSAQYISMTDTDRDGNAIDLGRITEGDVLRFSSVDGQVAELRIIDGTNGVFAFTKVSGDLDRLSEMPYQFILLSSFDPAGLATIDYVDAQDKALDEKIAAMPAAGGSSPLLWKYNPSVPADQLGNGEFRLSSGLDSGSASEWSIYFADRDAKGNRWFPHDGGSGYTHEIGDQLATIRGKSAIIAHGKTQKWYFNEGSNNHARLKLTYYRKEAALISGKYYLINVPGYMPLLPYSNDAYNNGTHS